MSNTLIGFLLMGSAIVIMGALFGFQAVKFKPKGVIRFPDSSFVWVFIYYVGTLMSDHGNDLEHCLAFAFLVIMIGPVLTLIFSLFWLAVFAGLERFADWYSGVTHN